MNRKSRRFPFFDDFDDFGFGTDFDRMFAEMELMMERVRNDPNFQSGKPLYYGYTMELGPDGKPEIKEYGNFRPENRPMLETASNDNEGKKISCGCANPIQADNIQDAQLSDRDECYACTMYDEKTDSLKVHADIPGVSKEDIELELDGRRLILNAKNENRNYHSEIYLEKDVNENSISAEYRNGVLEITLKCKKPKKQKNKKIKVD